MFLATTLLNIFRVKMQTHVLTVCLRDNTRKQALEWVHPFLGFDGINGWPKSKRCHVNGAIVFSVAHTGISCGATQSFVLGSPVFPVRVLK